MQLTTLQTKFHKFVKTVSNTAPVVYGAMVNKEGGFSEHPRLPGLALRKLPAGDSGYGRNGLAFIAANGVAYVFIGDTLEAVSKAGGKFSQELAGTPTNFAPVEGARASWVSSRTTSSYVVTSDTKYGVQPGIVVLDMTRASDTAQQGDSAKWNVYEVITGADAGFLAYSIVDGGPGVNSGHYPTVHVGSHEPTDVSGSLVKTIGLGTLHTLAQTRAFETALVDSYPENEGVRAWVAANYSRLIKELPDVQLGMELFVTIEQKAWIAGKYAYESRGSYSGGNPTTQTIQAPDDTAPAVQTGQVKTYGYVGLRAGEKRGDYRRLCLHKTGLAAWGSHMTEVTGRNFGPRKWSEIITNLFLFTLPPTETPFTSDVLANYLNWTLETELSDSHKALATGRGVFPLTTYDCKAYYHAIMQDSRNADNFLYVTNTVQEYFDSAVLAHFS